MSDMKKWIALFESENVSETFAPMGMEPEQSSSASYTQTTVDGGSSVSLTASGTDMDDIHRILKLAGMTHVVADAEEGDEVEMPVTEPEVDDVPCDGEYDDYDEVSLDDDPTYTTDVDTIKATLQDRLAQYMDR
jgi:hypothetical protein